LKVYRPTAFDVGIIQGIIYSDKIYSFITMATVQAGMGSAIIQDGVFTLKVEAGTYDLQATSDGYGNKTLSQVNVVANQVTDVSILMSSMGDLNGDTYVDLADAILAIQVMTVQSPAAVRNDYRTSGIDVNGDGRIGLQEAIYILQKVAGMR
jgi:hypothetical protein